MNLLKLLGFPGPGQIIRSVNLKQVVLIPGDGIGPEIAAAVKEIFKAAGVPVEWIEVAAGIDVIGQHPLGISEESLALIREHGVVLKGPTTTPQGGGHQSINVLIRRRLGLFANVRPVKTLPGIKTPFEGIDIITVRENLEDTYGGIEYYQSPNVAQGLKIISRAGAFRSVYNAFELASHYERKKITCVHKANIHKATDGLFLTVFREVSAQYPEIKAEDILVDNLCMQLVTRPEKFDVLVMPNLYGDIVSDLCAGLTGGLGLAPSANVGRSVVVFESVHGSAPDIAGKGVANPTALLSSALMLLRHIGLFDHANRIQRSLEKSFMDGKVTRDLGGDLTTAEFVSAICEDLKDEIPEQGESKAFVRKKLPALVLSTDSFERLVGIDLYFQNSAIPDQVPEEIGTLRLEAITNRGVRIESMPPEIDKIDVYCARYIASDSAVDQKDIRELLAAFDRLSINWVHVEKLFEMQQGNSFTAI